MGRLISCLNCNVVNPEGYVENEPASPRGRLNHTLKRKFIRLFVECLPLLAKNCEYTRADVSVLQLNKIDSCITSYEGNNADP